MNSLDAEDFKIEYSDTNGVISFCWLGKSLFINPSVILEPYFQQIIAEYKDKKIKMDFTKLEIMNASTLRPILNFIKSIEEERINLDLLYDSTVSWQETSFNMIEVLITDYEFIKITNITT